MRWLKELLNLSLATKCRLLFGAALLLIIAAALAVPFARSEALVQEQSLKAARVAAAAHLTYQLHSIYWEPSARLPRTDPEQFVPRPLSRFAVADLLAPDAATFVRLGRGGADVDAIADDFDRGSARRFVTQPLRGDETFELTSDGRFLHALAVRAQENCLACHRDGGAALRPDSPDLDFEAGELLGMVVTRLPDMDAGEQRLLNRVFFIVAGILASLLALLVFYLITQQIILRPVHELTKVAEQVSHGKLDVRSTVSTGDDYEVLAQAFNQMLAHVAVTQEQLSAANRGLNVRLDELAKINVGLDEANRLKSQFLANVSHELRTPLNSIIGFADLLMEQTAKDPRSQRYADHIRTSGQRLLELITDLLDLAKIEAGRMEVRVGPTSILGLVGDMLELLRPQQLAKALDLELIAPDRMPLLETDAGKVRQILYNLLSNAIKFTPDGGQVTVTVNDLGEEGVSVAVSDTGPGVPAESVDLIFEKFRQVDSTVTRQHAGTGLGLAISRELASMLQGDVTLQNRPGQGATFTLRLPRTMKAED